MTRYADPLKCPDCLDRIPFGALSCPSCGLRLEGPTAQELFRTLFRADELLERLRADTVQATFAVQPAARVTPAHPTAAPVPTPAAQRRNARAAGAEQPVDVRTPAPTPAGLSAASVPKILLGLGAVCLLVAALVFLAVTWSAMGVAARTGTLLGFTVLTGALSAWMARRDLRGAAEALSLVTLGLLTLDLFGARGSGWFGSLAVSGFQVLLGSVLVVVASAGALAVRRTPVRVLTGSEIVAGLGLLVVAAGLVGSDALSYSAALVASVLVAAAVAAVHDRLRLTTARLCDVVVAGLAWLVLTGTALLRAEDHASLRELWPHMEVWPALAAAALVGAVALLRRLPLALRVGATAVAALIVAVVGVLPFTRHTPTETTLAMVVVLLGAGLLTWVTRAPWHRSGVLALALGSAWMLLVTVRLGDLACARLVEAGSSTWAGHAGDRLPGGTSAGILPAAWTLPVAVAALVAVAFVLARREPLVERTLAPAVRLVPVLAGAAVVAIATAALYPVPVWLVLTMLLVTGAGLVVRAVGTRDLGMLSVGAAFLLVAVGLALHAEWLTAVALAVAVPLAALVHLRWPAALVGAVAGGLLAATVAFAVWTCGAIAGGRPTWTALAGILAMGALALAGPLLVRSWWSASEVEKARSGTEIGAAVSTYALAMAGVVGAPAGSTPTWVAVYLTVSGALVCTMSLLRADRRELGWLGGLLLAAASWVRLWDVGVQAPEAYTLPSAAALATVGLVHLRRTAGSGTMRALSPGLALGLVPSLLWTAWEPAGIRALLLGLACVALVLGGARLRWTAPVVWGAAVGAVLVLRLAAPVVDSAVPRWVLIGAAGALLVGTGVTWERRLGEARAVVGYVRRLR